MPAIEQVQEDGVPVDRYVTRDGTKLGLIHWDAPMPRAVIVALHGMNDYSNAFAMPAPWWATRGISTYAYDQRGFGRSPQTGHLAGRRSHAPRLGGLCRCHAARVIPNVPVFVLGESMGGAVAMSAFASDMPPKADGLILIAPAVWGRETMPFFYRLVLWTERAHVPRGVVHRLRAQGHAERQYRDAARERPGSAVHQEHAFGRDLRVGRR